MAACALSRTLSSLETTSSACHPTCRSAVQCSLCAVPVQRPLLEGLLRHCLADRWLAAAEEQGERG